MAEEPKGVQNITGPELDRIVAEANPDEVLILDLWADWCHPCKRIEPYLYEMAEKYPGRVRVLRLNIDHYPDVPARLGVMSIPTIIFYKGGQERWRYVGARPKKDYVRKTEELLEL